MHRLLVATFSLLATLAILPAEAQEKRVALVIGMGEYQHLASLNNPVPDAKAVAASLKAHGFEVSEHYNLPRADLLDVLEKFKREAAGAKVALVYYAGHGMEIEGKNVLAPTDMEVDCKDKTALRSVDLDQLFGAASPAPHQVVLLDACRNNPFPQCPTRGVGAGSGFRGFSRITEEDRSLLIANATLSGQLAADGDPGAHSPFAQSLLKNIEEHPRVYLRDLLDMTAEDVRIASRGAQVPEITTRGGAPRICLDASGCGEGGGTSLARGRADRFGRGRRGAKHVAATRLSRRCEPRRGRGPARRCDQALPGQGGARGGRQDHADSAGGVARDQSCRAFNSGKAGAAHPSRRARPSMRRAQTSRIATPVPTWCRSLPGASLMGAAKSEKGKAEGRGATARSLGRSALRRLEIRDHLR